MSRSDAVQNEKQHLRDEFRSRRDDVDDDQALRASALVSRRLSNHPIIDSAQTIAAYMAKGGEVDLQPYIEEALQEDVDILLPRVTGPGEMEFCPFEDWNQLEPGSFGIYEPTGPATSIDHVEVFLVPGLAFDDQGSRLGFGGGYYDRALPAGGRAVVVGVGHHWQFVDDLPAESHDRPMDHVVTDRNWHRISADDDTDGG